MPTASVASPSALPAAAFCGFSRRWYYSPAMTIDTLEYGKKLEAAGIDRKAAEARAEALREAVSKEVATKDDLDTAGNHLELQFEQRFQKIEARLQLLTWMVGFNLAATMAALWKLLR